MKKLLNWLFGSERSVKEMKSFASKDGNFCTEKSNKEKNNSDKGQFNIMVGYIEKFFGLKKRSEKKSISDSDVFLVLALSCSGVWLIPLLQFLKGLLSF